MSSWKMNYKSKWHGLNSLELIKLVWFSFPPAVTAEEQFRTDRAIQYK